MAESRSLGLPERAAAGATAALVAAACVNPFDIVKTRMQAQALASTSAASAPLCPCYTRSLYERWGICESLPYAVRRTPRQLAPPAAPNGGGNQSMWSTFRTITRQEGVAALWRGTGTSLLVSVPMVGVYMPLYDVLLVHATATGAAAPLLAGAAARLVAVFAVAPFELLRTRLQATTSGRAVDTLRELVSHPGGARPSWRSSLAAVPRLWTGFGATLARDVPFSAAYWAMLEPLRRAMLAAPSASAALAAAAPTAAGGGGLDAAAHWRHGVLRPTVAAAASVVGGGGGGGGGAHAPTSAAATSDGSGGAHHTQRQVLVANMASGFVSGGAAAALTTPADVVKTRLQLQPAAAAAPAARFALGGCVAGGGGGGGGGATAAFAAPPAPRTVLGTLGEVYRTEGVAGLFRGVTPRAARAAPACAIVISVYEGVKQALAHEE